MPDTKIDRAPGGRVTSVTGDRLDTAIFVTLDDTLQHLEASTAASRTASAKLERLTLVLIILTAALVVLTALLVADALGLVALRG